MGGGGMGGPGMEGPGGGGGPGDGAGGGPSGGPLHIKALVRWETAAPIRDASKRQFPRDPSGWYVIGVSGLPGMSARGAGRGAPGRDAAGGDDRSRATVEDLGKATFLERKGREPLTPVHTEADAGGALLFYFPKDADPISLDDKEVIFRTMVATLELKVRFVPKDMRYRGKLTL